MSARKVPDAALLRHAFVPGNPGSCDNVDISQPAPKWTNRLSAKPVVPSRNLITGFPKAGVAKETSSPDG